MNVLRLHPEGGGPPIVIDQLKVRVGRDSASEVHLRDASVSRHHAGIERRGEDWVIIDRDSGNGIRVDGKRTQEAVLLPGQELHIGNLRFRVEIDRGDDGATMMLTRSPLLEPTTDRTLLASGPPVFLEPPAEPEAEPEAEPQPAPASWAVPIALVVVVLAGIALSVFAYRTMQRPKVTAAAPPRFPTPLPTPVATPTPPEPIPTPTPTPVPRPTGSLLVSTDVDARVSIDGHVVAELKATGLRRFSVAPGEHIVRFIADSDRSQTEVVARVRVNEQTVVRRGGSSDVSPSATPTPAAPTPTTPTPATPTPGTLMPTTPTPSTLIPTRLMPTPTLPPAVATPRPTPF